VKSPGVFTGIPDDWSTVPPELIAYEREGIKAVCTGDRKKAMMAGGECAQRVKDLPKVQDLIDRIMKETTEIVRNMHQHLADESF
jgi:enoyl-[acyl-carrier protein] reductase II